eukprot:COSAG02_NODE_1831_length_10724_cov_44.091859_11_plen_113_part_00
MTSKIADGAVTSDKLSGDVSFDTDGTITLNSASGNAVLKINEAVSGVSSAGFGTIQGGPLEQYGFLIDENPLSGTYQKSLAYANQFESIIPGNAGTGWFPLSVVVVALVLLQ